MADQGTIKFRTELDTKPVIDGFDDLHRKGREFGGSFAKLFGLEPVGERRMRGALAGIAGDLAGAKSGAEGAASAMATLGRSLSLGAGVGAGIAVVTTLVNRLVGGGEELRVTASGINKEFERLSREAKLTIPEQGLDAITASANETRKSIRQIGDELAKSEEKHPSLRLFERSARNILTNPLHPIRAVEEAVAGPAHMAQQREAEIRIQSKNQDNRLAALQIEVQQQEKLLSGSHREIEDEKIDIEAALKRRSIESARGLDNTEAIKSLEKETSIKKELTKSDEQARLAEIRSRARITELQVSSLSRDEMSVALAKEKVEAAKDQESAAATRGPEARAEARSATRAAAAGVGEAAGSQLEKAGAEEAMSPQEKQAQYQQRLKQFEGIRHAAARQGINTDLITAPKFGDAEYDPTAAYRSAVAQQADEKAKEDEKSAADQKAQEADAAKGKEAYNKQEEHIGKLTQDYAKRQGIDMDSPSTDRAFVRQAAINESNQAGVSGDQGTGGDSSWSTNAGVSPTTPEGYQSSPTNPVTNDGRQQVTPSGATAPTTPTPNPTATPSGTPGYSFINASGNKVDVAARAAPKDTGQPITAPQMDAIMNKWWG